MTVWRMAMRCGSGGYDMPQECITRGVAAITYGPLEELDLSAFPEGKPRERSSLHRQETRNQPGDDTSCHTSIEMLLKSSMNCTE
ncbi:MAG: hypothetical protein ACYC0X_12530 [Pirellulaceae bacterium]